MRPDFAMEPDRWQQIQDVFHEARALPKEDRERFLSSRCESDEVRRDVHAMLTADARAGDFLERSDEGLDEALFERIRRAETMPERIGPYRILHLLDRGGMGSVYLAERADGQISRRVAVKLLRRELDTEYMVERFRSERQALAQLEHPNIARLYNAGVTEEGRPYFVMEYVEGVPVTDYAEARSLSTEARLRLFLQVCTAVHYAHAHLVLHRDLKPANILVSEDRFGIPQVKLVDFGLSRELSPEGLAARVTQTAHRMLTPRYASPEHVRGEPLTTASDVYSLGVVLYELLSGACPYDVEASSPLAMERAVCRALPEPPSTTAYRALADKDPARAKRLRRRLRGNLDAVVLKALEKDAEARYASPELLKTDVERHLRGEPLLAQRYSWMYPLRRLKRRLQPYWSRAAAAAIVVLLIVIAAMMHGPVDKNPVRAEMNGNLLHVLNAAGQRIGTLDVVDSDVALDDGNPFRDAMVFFDVDGDGRNEVIYGEGGPDPHGRPEEIEARRLGDTEPLWRFPLSFDLDYPRKSGTDFRQYNTQALHASDVDGNGYPELFAVTSNQGSFASVVLELDPRTGKELQRYVHPGHFSTLVTTDLNGDGIEELVLAGVNNSLGKEAVLVVLDPRNMQGRGPHEGDYEVAGYEMAKHIAYLRFPPTLLREVLLSKSSRATLIAPDLSAGTMQVRIDEGAYRVPARGGSLRIWMQVLLDRDFKVLDVNTADEYDVVAAKLLRDGHLPAQLDHAYWEEWKSRVRYWDVNGWVTRSP